MRGWRGPYRRLRRADAAGRPPGAAATWFGREGYRCTPVTVIARDVHAGSTVAYAYFPGREAVFRTAAEADASGIIREELAAAAAPRWRPGPIRYSSPTRLTRYPARTAGPHRSHVSGISCLLAAGQGDCRFMAASVPAGGGRITRRR